MNAPSPLLHSLPRRQPVLRRWILTALHKFDQRTIKDWVGLMRDHLRRPGNATAITTARYTSDVIEYLEALQEATEALSTLGDPVSRSQLADAARDLSQVLRKFYGARVILMRVAGLQPFNYTD